MSDRAEVAAPPEAETLDPGAWPHADRERVFANFEAWAAVESGRSSEMSDYYDRVRFVPGQVRMVHYERRNEFTDESVGRGRIFIDIEDDVAPVEIRHRRFTLRPPESLIPQLPPNDTVYGLQERRFAKDDRAARALRRTNQPERTFLVGSGSDPTPEQVSILTEYLERLGLM